MSAPKRAVRDAQEIAYGFLAAKASIALGHAIDRRQLSVDERAVLSKAAKFLDEIANGALITKGNVLEGVRPSKSLAALDVAFGPLDTLKKVVNDGQDGIAPVFSKMSEAVRSLQEGSYSADLTVTIAGARQFFDGLSGWLATELANRKRFTGRMRSSGTL